MGRHIEVDDWRVQRCSVGEMILTLVTVVG